MGWDEDELGSTKGSGGLKLERRKRTMWDDE